MVLPGANICLTRMQLVDGLVCKLKELGKEEFVTEHLHDTLAFHVKNHKRKALPETEYIYATQSDAFLGLLKIGRSCDVSKRLASANTFTAPKPHRLVAIVPTLDSVRDEKKTHTFFKSQHEEGEFFRVTVDEVNAFFTMHILSNYNQEIILYENQNDEEET